MGKSQQWEAYQPPERKDASAAEGFWSTATFREKLIIAVGAVTLLSPIDIAPEALLGPLGLIDDGAALWMVLSTISDVRTRLKESRRYQR